MSVRSEAEIRRELTQVGVCLPAGQRGFTLIEALIAFVILSIGLLGIVSLQGMAKTSQHLAIQHSRAVTLADAIIERIRANPAGVPTYNIGVGDSDYLGGGRLGTTPILDCRSNVCDDAVKVANYDLWAWEQALMGAGATITEGGTTTNTAGLINPRGCIVFTAAAGKVNTGELRVIIQWRGLHESSDAVQTGQAVCGPAWATADKEYRRQVVTNTYVVDEEEF